MTKKKVYHFPSNRLKNNRKDIDMESKEFLEKISVWTSYYRLFPHIFVKDYLGITLKPFQAFLLFMMMKSSYFIYIAARGQGKTFLTAIYAVIRAILYPGSLVVVASATKSQAMEMFMKIESIYEESDNFKRECSRPPTKSDNMPRIMFKNKSMIRVVASSDNARGARAHVLILDESGRMDSDMIASVLRKFKATPRQPKYLDKEKYRGRTDLLEPNQEISLSSATMKVKTLWRSFLDRLDGMVEGKNYFVCGLPYQISIKENLLLKQSVKEEMESAEFNEEIWSMEMDAMFYGSASEGFFSLGDFDKARTIDYPLYPRWAYDLIPDKRFSQPQKQSDEVRLLSVDVALSNASGSDNAVITIARLIPNGNRYYRYYSNMMVANGAGVDELTLLIKRHFKDFDCDYAVLDAQGIGLAVYDSLAKETRDSDRSEFYDPWICINNDNLASRPHDDGAKPIVYSINANDRLNTNIAFNFKDHLKRGIALLPVDKYQGIENLKELKDYDKLLVENKVMFESQYKQFDTLIMEMINLKYKTNDGRNTMTFHSDGKKDRYSSASYLDYIADQLEKGLSEDDSGSWEDYILFN